ncbi:hypothetical protein Nepgr_005387 [Nepenthes gracilis]|uniref:Uncharacterized protein n=1 Tax=Nepenthes gracilis TaxID=150966 RepID=A0AAD3S362_NEPGR|nr:hypothetical protein Nepgr_005387 [Nepenthes gracilis]
MQIVPVECKSPSVLQDPGVADVQLSNAMIRLDNQNLGGADGLISSQVIKLARSDDKSGRPAHSNSGAAVVPCSNHDPTLSGPAEHHQLDDLLPDDAGLEMTLATDPPPSSIIAPFAQAGQVHCSVSVDPIGDLDLTPSSITRISNNGSSM